MRKLIAKTAKVLKASSLLAARLLSSFNRAEHGAPPVLLSPPSHDRRRRRLLFGLRRRRAVDRAWGLRDLLLSVFNGARKQEASGPVLPSREPR